MRACAADACTDVIVSPLLRMVAISSRLHLDIEGELYSFSIFRAVKVALGGEWSLMDITASPSVLLAS
jgi:hypothetical protein